MVAEPVKKVKFMMAEVLVTKFDLLCREILARLEYLAPIRLSVRNFLLLT